MSDKPLLETQRSRGSPPASTSSRGHCLCGAIQYEVLGPLRPIIYCQICGSNLFWDPAAGDAISIMAGSLNAPTGLAAREHIFSGGSWRLLRHQRRFTPAPGLAGAMIERASATLIDLATSHGRGGPHHESDHP